MARSKRRRSFSRKRVSADWVFRPCLVDVAGAVIDDLGTYDQIVGTLVAGAANANFSVLYDSHNHVAQTMGALAGAPIRSMPQAARAEASRALIMRVQGVCIYRPTAWAVGSIFSLGFRFGIWEQDAQTGNVLVDPAYSMWASGGAGVNQLRPATWANDRNWQHERRTGATFGENNSAYFMQRFNFRVNRRLDPNECYGIWMEADTFFVSSINLQYQLWFRTLVADEG